MSDFHGCLVTLKNFMALDVVGLHSENRSRPTVGKIKSYCVVFMVLCAGIGIIHYDSVMIGQNNHNSRKQFEYGLVKSLTNQHLIHDKKWSQSFEIFHCILGKWKLNGIIRSVNCY